VRNNLLSPNCWRKLAEKAKEEARKRLGVGGAEALTLAGFRLLS
jgi:hypothetical protein